MAEPLTVLEQMRQNWFKPDRMIVVYFAVANFNRVGKWDERTGKFIQHFKNLPNAKTDCDTMKQVLDYYKIDDKGDKVYDLSNDPSLEEFEKVYTEIGKLLAKGKQKQINYLTIFLFAGHGILNDGMQCLVLNEYD